MAYVEITLDEAERGGKYWKADAIGKTGKGQFEVYEQGEYNGKPTNVYHFTDGGRAFEVSAPYDLHQKFQKAIKAGLLIKGATALWKYESDIPTKNGTMKSFKVAVDNSTAR